MSDTQEGLMTQFGNNPRCFLAVSARRPAPTLRGLFFQNDTMANYDKSADRGTQLIMKKFLPDRMEDLGITQYRLAQILDVNRSTVKRWFDGDVNISLHDFLRICGALNLNPYLVPKEGDDTPKNYEHFN